MGYSTYFEGTLNINPPLSQEQIEDFERLKKYYLDQAEDYEEQILTSKYGELPALVHLCWEIKNNGSLIVHDCSAKDYSWDDWLQWLCENFFSKTLSVASGEFYWSGEEIGDSGLILVEKNTLKILPLEELAEHWKTSRRRESEPAMNEHGMSLRS